MKGGTAIGLINEGEIIIASDGYLIRNKKFKHLDSGKIVRTDWFQDVTADFREGSPAMEYYTALWKIYEEEYDISQEEADEIKHSWTKREKLVVTHDDTPKIVVLRVSSNIVLTFCGYYKLFSRISERLKAEGEMLTIDRCVELSQQLLRQNLETEESDYEEGSDMNDFDCNLLFATYEKQSSGDLVPRLVYVDKFEFVNVEKYKCIGHGSSLAGKSLTRHCSTDIGKELAAMRVREAIEAASLERMSGGLIESEQIL
ncbi:hypothetical protein MKW92_046337 [Papaver armeniacum]|nr:hypothetical protein MKW92_046337 [Papaver armeniacum]